MAPYVIFVGQYIRNGLHENEGLLHNNSNQMPFGAIRHRVVETDAAECPFGSALSQIIEKRLDPFPFHPQKFNLTILSYETHEKDLFRLSYGIFSVVRQGQRRPPPLHQGAYIGQIVSSQTIADPTPSQANPFRFTRLVTRDASASTPPPATH